MKLLTSLTCLLNATALCMMLQASATFAQSAPAAKQSASNVTATLSQPQQELIHAIEQYLLEKTADMHGDTSIHVLLPSKELPQCDTFDISMPAGRRITSRTTVEVRCLGRSEIPASFIRVDITVEGEYYVPNQVIELNRFISADMLQAQKGDLLRLPEGTQTELQALVGRSAAQRLPANRPIKASATRGADAISRGQIVQIQAQAPGLTVTNQGEAITSAEVGAPIQVKTPQGKVIRGVARPGGIVEVLM